MNKHAYLILVHTNPEQVRSLLLTLDDRRNDIFIHIDARAPFGTSEFDGFCHNAGLFFTSRREHVHWGGVSIMRAELDLLEAATSRGSYAYYHLLSGMDLPIKSQNVIHDFFDANPGKQFLHFWKMPSHTLNRVKYYTLFPEGARSFYTNLPNHGLKAICKFLGFEMNKDVDFKEASQWFSITDDFARYTITQRSWLEKVFRHTTMIDEIFLPTLLMASPFRDSVYDATEHSENSSLECTSNMRLIDWTRGSSVRHPWTFTSADYDMLTSVPHFWARKFNVKVDSQIVDKIVDYVLKSDSRD